MIAGFLMTYNMLQQPLTQMFFRFRMYLLFSIADELVRFVACCRVTERLKSEVSFAMGCIKASKPGYDPPRIGSLRFIQT